LGLAGDGQEKLELWGELVLGVQAVREVDSADAAVSVDLDSEGLDVVGTVGTAGEVRQVELNLIPALVESHGHGADEGLDAGCALVVGGAEATAHVLVVQDLHLEGEVLLQVLDDHHEEGKLDGEGLLGVDGAGNEVGRDVGAHDFEDRGLNVGVGDSLDVAVSHVLVPNLEGLRTDRVENREETALEGALDFFFISFCSILCMRAGLLDLTTSSMAGSGFLAFSSSAFCWSFSGS